MTQESCGILLNPRLDLSPWCPTTRNPGWFPPLATRCGTSRKCCFSSSPSQSLSPAHLAAPPFHLCVGHSSAPSHSSLPGISGCPEWVWSHLDTILRNVFYVGWDWMASSVPIILNQSGILIPDSVSAPTHGGHPCPPGSDPIPTSPHFCSTWRPFQRNPG